MALGFSVPTRNTLADAFGTHFDTTGVLELRSGSKPAGGPGDAPTGTLLASITLPADPWGAAATGVIAKLGTWQDASADAAGTAGYFRFKLAADAGTTNTTDKRVDGTITVTGGGGDLTLDNTSIGVGQVVSITSFGVTYPAS